MNTNRTTADYIDALRANFNVDSDFAAMSKLGVKHRQQVSEWRKLHGAFGESLSLKVADALDIPRDQVLLDMQIQRESNEEVRAIWQRIAERMAVAASLVGVAILGATLWPQGDALPLLAMAGTTANTGTLYIMSNATAAILLALAAFYLLAFWSSTLRRHFVAAAAFLALTGCAAAPEPVHREQVKVWRDASGVIRMKSETVTPAADITISDTPRRDPQFKHIPPHRPSWE